MSFHSLRFKKLDTGVSYHNPDHLTFNHVKLTDPAIKVMTDLKHVQAITVSPTTRIDDALKIMIDKGVRMLFVIDFNHQIVGLVTTNDIYGEKPVQISGSSKILRNEISVKDLMIPVDKIDVLEIKDVSDARVGDIMETLESVSRRHVLVVDHQGEGNKTTMRGIFSMSKIEKHLGLTNVAV